MAEIIRIPDGNAFLLRVTGQIRTGDYTEDADFSVVTHMGVNFVRRGRIAQTFGLDSLGRIVIENSGNLAQGVYGVELYGYYHGEPWRNYQKNVFQIVNENANSDPGSDNENVLTYDVTFDVTFGGDGISAAFVEATVATHNGDQESHPDLREEIEEKVSDVKVGDTSVVEGGVAVIDLSGKQDVIDDLSTIRSGAAAGGTAYQKPGTGIPESDMSDAVKAKLAKAETALQEHQDISGKQDVISDLSAIRSGAAAGGTAYQKPGTGIPASDLSSEVQDMIENGGKTKSVSVNGGTPVTPDANGQVDLTIEQANVTIGTVTTGAAGSNADVHNSGTGTAPVLDFVIPKGDTGDTGPQGPQGATGVYDQTTQDFLTTLETTTGQSQTKTMTQKAITDELDSINFKKTAIDLSEIYALGFYYYNGKWNTSNTISGKHICVRPGAKYEISASERLARIWMMETFNTPVANASASATKLDVPAGTTVVVTIPNGIHHFYIQNNSDVVENSEAYPSSIKEVISDSIQVSAGWVDDITLKNALNGTELIAEYGYLDCVNKNVMKIDGSVTNVSSTHFAATDYISIPENADILIYSKANADYQEVNAGICLCDANHVVIWYDGRQESVTTPYVDGIIDLSQYPNAAFVRYMPSVRTLDGFIRFYKKGGNDFSKLNGVLNSNDNLKAYGSAREADSYNYASGVKYVTSKTPCEKDGILSLIYGRFRAGTCTLYIGHIDQNGYLVIRDTFQVVTTTGYNKIDISQRGIFIQKDEYVLCGTSGAVAYFKTGTGEPSAFYVDQEEKAREFSNNTFQTLAWVVRTHVDSFDDISETITDMQTEININKNDIESLKSNKKHFITDSVTGTNYEIVVRNGVIALQPTLYSHALVLGNSIAIHEITDFWWGEWGMAATKQEYDFAHILEEGLQVQDENATMDVVQMRPWEQDFSISLATLIGNKLTSSTDLVVIRVGGNVPNDHVSGLQSALGGLVDYIRSISPNAKIVITGNFGVDVNRENAIIGAADDKNIDYVRIDQFATSEYKEATGHYVYGNDGEIHEIDSSGVAWHPNNKGMLAIANTILNAIGYAPVRKSYSLKEVTVGGVTGTMYVED